MLPLWYTTLLVSSQEILVRVRVYSFLFVLVFSDVFKYKRRSLSDSLKYMGHPHGQIVGAS